MVRTSDLEKINAKIYHRLPAIVGEAWSTDVVEAYELYLLRSIFSCRTPEAVQAAISFSKFLKPHGVTATNWGLYLTLFQVENHWVIDTLIGDTNPYLFFETVQPNKYMVEISFSVISSYHSGEIYYRTLQVLLGIIKKAYSNPFEAFKIYPLSEIDIQNIGKYLDFNDGSESELNSFILGLLAKIAQLEAMGKKKDNSQMTKAGSKAKEIRDCFICTEKSLLEAIPEIMLTRGDYTKKEVAPY